MEMELRHLIGLRFKGNNEIWGKDLIKGKVYTLFYYPLSNRNMEFDYIIYDEFGREVDFSDNRKQYFKEV